MSDSELGVGPRFAKRIKENHQNPVHAPISAEKPFTVGVVEPNLQAPHSPPNDENSKTPWTKTRIITSN